MSFLNETILKFCVKLFSNWICKEHRCVKLILDVQM